MESARKREIVRVAWVRLGIVCGTAALIAGCGRRSPLLLERQASGPAAAEQTIARQANWVMEPSSITQAQQGVEVMVSYASPEYLNDFFNNREIFGRSAGLNPFFPEQIVFYVKLANHSGKRILVKPASYVLLDDHGNQFHHLRAEYITALAESKAPVMTLTRGVIEDARPGYFGLSLPVGRILPKSVRRYSLLSMASFREGYLYDGVVHDGLVSFWNPPQETKHMKLILSVKTDFNADDEPQTALEFTYEFATSRRTKK